MPRGSWWNGMNSWSWLILSPLGFPTWLPSAITRGTDFLCIITHFLLCSWSMISVNTLTFKFSPINLPQIIQISVNLYGHALSEILKNCVPLRESTCWWCFEIILPLQRGHVPSPSRMILLLCMWLIISVDISYQSSKKVDTPYSSKPLRSSIVTYPRELCSTTRILTCWWRFEIIPTVLTSGEYEFLELNGFTYFGRDFPDSGSIYTSKDSGGEIGVPYEAYFPMPTSAADKPWYSIASGPVHFTIMSTEHNWTSGSEQVSINPLPD